MNRGFLCIAYAMLCHSVAYTATIHRFTRTSVLELGKATLSQILLPNNIYRLNIILMAKLQLLAITTLDGYLFDRTVSSPLWDNPNKYGLTKIRERATQTLGPDVSFISLTQWKKKNEGIYFIEAAPDTISVISTCSDTGWWMKSSFLSHRISKGTAYVCLQKFPVLPHGK